MFFMHKKEMPPAKFLITPPAYIDERVLQEIKKRNLSLMPNMAEVLGWKRGQYSEFTFVDTRSSDNPHAITGIEICQHPSYTKYGCNVALLHEIGHSMNGRLEKILPRYTAEKRAWKNAEKIRRRIGYPREHRPTMETWEGIEEASLKTYENVRITKKDVLSYLAACLKTWLAIFLFLAIITGVLLLLMLPAQHYSPNVLQSELLSFYLRVAIGSILPAVSAPLFASFAGIKITAKFFGLTTEEWLKVTSLPDMRKETR